MASSPVQTRVNVPLTSTDDGDVISKGTTQLFVYWKEMNRRGTDSSFVVSLQSSIKNTFVFRDLFSSRGKG